MRVAIAGSGDMSRYFSEEFLAAGHEVVVLTRGLKSYFENSKAIQVVTDYSVDSLLSSINDCHAMVSTILDYSMNFVDVHRNLIEACTRSSTCRRFIPSEYSGNLEVYPDQPMFYYPNHEPVRKILREQNKLEWTVVSVGWLSDYMVPQHNRYLSNMNDGAFPVNLTNGSILIPGTGQEPLELTAARDVAKGVAQLLKAPKWENYTYMSGESTCWADVARQLQGYIPRLTIHHITLKEAIDAIIANTSEVDNTTACYQIFSMCGAASFDPKKISGSRQRFFPDVHFRTLKQLLDEVGDRPYAIL